MPRDASAKRDYHRDSRRERQLRFRDRVCRYTSGHVSNPESPLRHPLSTESPTAPTLTHLDRLCDGDHLR